MRRDSTLPALGATLVLGLALGCGGGGGAANPATPPPPPPVVEEPNPDASATYRVTFDATWSGATIPNSPNNPHFSPLVGATHLEATRFWEVGATASDGIRAMAEEGRTTPLDDEIEAAIARGEAEHLLLGGGINRSPETVRLTFDVSLEQPYVTLVSMVAPSPDWFVGVSALSLLVDGDWAQRIEVELFAYDAGTDDGRNFTSSNRPLVPRVAIERIDGGPFRVNGEVRSLGTFTFRRLS